MLVVVAELLDLLDSMELLVTQLLLVRLVNLEHQLAKVAMEHLDLKVVMVKRVLVVPLVTLVDLVVMVVMVVMVLAVHLVNLDHLVNREKHSDRDHRLSVEGAKEIEERGGKSIEVGQNHAVVLDRSGKVISQ
tara:strand:- start:125 stop:523 length:399 start_codon:yes stop_codon:yes gene_type:complete